MDENQKHMACAWCDGEIRHGDKAYKRTGYYGIVLFFEMFGERISVTIRRGNYKR